MLNLKFSHLSEETPGLVTLEFLSGEIIHVELYPVELYGSDSASAEAVVTQVIPISVSVVSGDRCELEALPIFSVDIHAAASPGARMVVDSGLGLILNGHDMPLANVAVVVVIPVVMNGADNQHGKMVVRGITKRRVDDGIRRGPCNLQFSCGNQFSNVLELDHKYRKPPPIANRASVSISAYVH